MDVITRRQFLKAGGAAALGLGLGPTLMFRIAGAAEAKARGSTPVLVQVFLRGGMDGLSAVVPYGDPEYRKLRRATALPPPKKDGGVRRLDGRFGLHPALGALHEDYRAKRLAVVHAVGSPDPTRSHFDAQDYMESGTPGRKGTADGWANRYLAASSPEKASTFRAVALTPQLPRTLKGASPALAIGSFDGFGIGGRRGEGGGIAEALGAMYGADREEELHRTGTEAFDAVKELRRVNPQQFKPENGAAYPRGRLGQEMLAIAQLIKSDVGLQLAFASGGGWDTHLNQGAATGSLANRLRELGDSLHAFSQDLGDRMEHVVVVVMTEFGRTAKENGTGGTDHGHGSTSLLLGGPVAGGKVHGKWPGLKPNQLWQKRDLAVTTDFRNVLAEVLTRHLGATDLAAVFPGHRPKRIGVIS